MYEICKIMFLLSELLYFFFITLLLWILKEVLATYFLSSSSSQHLSCTVTQHRCYSDSSIKGENRPFSTTLLNLLLGLEWDLKLGKEQFYRSGLSVGRSSDHGTKHPARAGQGTAHKMLVEGICFPCCITESPEVHSFVPAP